MGDPRVFFAAERTLLAWIRTGLTVMAFGFLVARFGVFLRIAAAQLGAEAHAPRLAPLSHVIGVLLVLAGTFSILIAAREHRAFLRTLPESDRPAGRDARLHERLAAFLGLLGVLLTVYLVL
ncbi:MAG: YidH family protein [Thermoanaerobaculia bacterium]